MTTPYTADMFRVRLRQEIQDLKAKGVKISEYKVAKRCIELGHFKSDQTVYMMLRSGVSTLESINSVVKVIEEIAGETLPPERVFERIEEN